MLTKKFSITLIGFCLVFQLICRGQQNSLYVPTDIVSPHFREITGNETMLTGMLSNYGLIMSGVKQKNKFFAGLKIQYNNGGIQFDPLNFNDYLYQGEETHLIQPKPVKVYYGETYAGYSLDIGSQTLTVSSGIGHQFNRLNNRLFVQLYWGNSSRIIDAGISCRGNFTVVNTKSLAVLEPIVQGKLKVGNFRIVNGFGYAVAIRRGEDYMKPMLSVGLEYCWPSRLAEVI